MMSRLMLLAALVIALPAFAAAQTKGPNGGMVVRIEDHPIEFVHTAEEIVFYIGDHDGKPYPTKGLQARAIIQAGGKTITVPLTPAEPNRFVGKLAAPLAPNTRVVLSTRFDNHAFQARFVVN